MLRCKSWVLGQRGRLSISSTTHPIHFLCFPSGLTLFLQRCLAVCCRSARHSDGHRTSACRPPRGVPIRLQAATRAVVRIRVRCFGGRTANCTHPVFLLLC